VEKDPTNPNTSSLVLNYPCYYINTLDTKVNMCSYGVLAMNVAKVNEVPTMEAECTTRWKKHHTCSTC
jgi:hypothetical protein